MKRKILYTDKKKERLLRISYNPRTEPVPRKHLILQHREEEQRNKLQNLIDEFSQYTEPRFESSMFEFAFILTCFSSFGTLDDATR
jgi:hemerythrin